MPPKISVIVPVYKAEQYLPCCLDSILAQTYEHLEIICVNDGSPDNSLAILERYAARDSRIRVISQKNQGVSVARNTALTAATGEFLMFVDSDDFIKPNMAEVMLHTLEEHNADIVNCQYNNYISADNIKGRDYSHPPLVCGKEDALWLLLEDKQVTSHLCRNLFKRKLFHDIRFPEGKMYEDIIITPQIFLRADTFVFLSDAFYQYVLNRESITQVASYKNREDFLKALLSVAEFVKKHTPSLFDRYLSIYFKKMLFLRYELLTIDRKADKDRVLCQSIERELKKYLSLKLCKEQPAAFFKILALDLTRPLLSALRHVRILRYSLLSMFCTSKKKQYYLDKLKRYTG